MKNILVKVGTQARHRIPTVKSRAKECAQVSYLLAQQASCTHTVQGSVHKTVHPHLGWLFPSQLMLWFKWEWGLHRGMSFSVWFPVGLVAWKDVSPSMCFEVSKAHTRSRLFLSASCFWIRCNSSTIIPAQCQPAGQPASQPAILPVMIIADLRKPVLKLNAFFYKLP